MSNYRMLGLLLVALAVGYALGYHTGAASQPSQQAVAAGPAAAAENCCTVPARPPRQLSALPTIPPASGLPGLVEFGSDECDACRRMQPVLKEVAQRSQGRLEVILVDTDDHPAAAQKWRLRLIPTQILVAAGGQELWRHEGFIPLTELQQVLSEHLPEK